MYKRFVSEFLNQRREGKIEKIQPLSPFLQLFFLSLRIEADNF